MASTSFSTYQAAELLDIRPHVLQSNYRRRGHYRGVTPNQAPNGRLYWPARDVLAHVMPAGDTMPDWFEVFSDYVEQVAPEIGPLERFRLGSALLCGPANLPNWRQKSPGHAELVLSSEPALVMTFATAWRDRVDALQVLGHQKDAADLASELIAERFRHFLPTRAHDVEGA